VFLAGLSKYIFTVRFNYKRWLAFSRFFRVLLRLKGCSPAFYAGEPGKNKNWECADLN
jgi:hypothetical protein